MVRKTLSKIAVIAAAFSLFTAPAYAVNLVGGGATFANPILDACKAEYARATGDSYVYNSLGSGAGRPVSIKVILTLVGPTLHTLVQLRQRT